MLNHVLVLRHQVVINRLPHGGDAHLLEWYLTDVVIVHVRKDTTNPSKSQKQDGEPTTGAPSLQVIDDMLRNCNNSHVIIYHIVATINCYRRG